MILKKSLSIGLITATVLLSGCMSSSPEPTKDTIVVYETDKYNSNELSESSVINMDLPSKSVTSIDRNEIILSDNLEGLYPTKELLTEVSAITFENKKFGDVINILTSNFKNTSVIFEPNVDPELNVYIRTGKMKLYDLIKMISTNLGYHAYYSERRKALVISPYVTRKYSLPAGIFVKKEVEQQLGQANSGSGTGNIELNSEDPIKVIERQLELLGSTDKVINFDRSSGTLIIKEHPLYISEIDDFIVDFAQERSRKFILEMAIFDIVLTNDQSTGFNINELEYNPGGKNSLSLTNILGGSDGSNAVLSQKQFAQYTDPSSGMKMSPGLGGLSFNMTLNMMKNIKNSVMVDKAKVIVPNHDVNYIGSGRTNSYVESIEPIVNESGVTRYVSKMGQVYNGISFVSRIDGFKNKDYIEVSLAPSVKKSIIGTGEGAPVDGVGYAPDTVEEQVRETMSTTNIESGDIIIVGGLISEEEVEVLQKNPLFSDIPLLNDVLGINGEQKSRVETIFVVQVKELNAIEETHRIPSYKMKDELENRY